MIKISKLADYGTVILSFLAEFPDQRFSANQIAEQISIPTPTVSKLLKMLNEVGLVNSTRGANGGYELSRNPAEISIAEIIGAIDGQLALTECSKNQGNCNRSRICGLRHNWQYINSMIISLLRELTLADMNKPLAKAITLKTSDFKSKRLNHE